MVWINLLKPISKNSKTKYPSRSLCYVAAKDKKKWKKEAEEFYKAASPYKPTYYWLDVEENHEG